MNILDLLNIKSHHEMGLSTLVKNSVLLHLFTETLFTKWIKTKDRKIKNWVKDNKFFAKPGTVLLIPDDNFKLIEVYSGINEKFNFWDIAKIKQNLPQGKYKLANSLANDESYSIAWALENYRFSPFKKINNQNPNNYKSGNAELYISKSTFTKVNPVVQGCYLARDLINFPANYLSPEKWKK